MGDRTAPLPPPGTWWRQDGSTLATLLRSGGLTAERLLDLVLDRIQRLDPALNSFVAIDHAGARAAARRSDERRQAGQALSDLDGLPIAVKDNLLVAGLPATWGSRAFRDHVPAQDELPIARLRAAGAVLVGKTNVPELTLEGYTSNALFGTTRNPWDTRLTPGGSSGGAAAAVAAGLVPMAVGTDGGGSIRRPACHTGLIGWKPSTGRIARAGGFPVILADFEVIGTLTRSVADARLLDAALAGPDPNDRASFAAPAPPWPVRPRRILHVPRFGHAPVDPEVTAATDAVAARLAAEGHAVDRGTVFFDIEAAARIWHVISRAGVAWLLGREAGRLDAVGPSARGMAADGAALTAADYADALDRVTALRQRVARLFATYDLVLTPAAAALPWPAEAPFPSMIDGQAAGPRDHAAFTGWVNIAGLPAAALPAGRSASGLPIGVQFVAGFGADLDLLDFMAAFEQRSLAHDPPWPRAGA